MVVTMSSAAALLLISALITYASLATLYRWWADRLVLDVPNERSLHTDPVPRGAGIVISTVAISLFGVGVFANVVDARTYVIFAAGAGLVALISWIDDIHDLSNTSRLLAQGLAALNALAVFGYWHEATLPLVGVVHLGWMGLPITFLWIVGLANAMNFIDGIDGLACSQGVITGLVWTVVGLLLNLPLVADAGVILAGACFGTLFYNWAPARVFLGDVGSVFLGYTFAIVAVYAGRIDARLVSVAGILFAPIVLDTGLTFLFRLVRGQNVFRSHRSHLYQRLVVAGRPHWQVAVLYLVATCLAGSAAIVWLL
jgi:UDP-N-acetylmuramyl pentapeptide phosphotransferase/UDP-N-acetylglucosamine-1-phosphate transferase